MNATIDALRHLSTEQQLASGRALRKKAPRRRIAEFEPEPGRDPIALLREQNAARIPSLVPVRRERMSESAFSFYRGAAAVMAHDLARTPVTGVDVQACGDAHLSNFGVFASRDRDLVFDVNDFDETAVAPWEWDVKRLVSSVVIHAQQAGLSNRRARIAAAETARAYRLALAEFAALSANERFFTSIRADGSSALTAGYADDVRREASRVVRKARRNTSERALTKLAVAGDDGRYRIQENPPLVVRLPEFTRAFAEPILRSYLESVPEDIGALLANYTVQDIVVRVVGVGSVGTRCFLVLFTDGDGSPLFLQIKEATASVLERYASVSTWSTPGHRVVAGQRIMQSTGDPFLGHFHVDGIGSYYLRQFRDMKGSVDLAKIGTTSTLSAYGRMCGRALARAHAQSGVPGVIAGYLGGKETISKVDHAFADFGFAYSDVNLADYASLLEASDAEWFDPEGSARRLSGFDRVVEADEELAIARSAAEADHGAGSRRDAHADADADASPLDADGDAVVEVHGLGRGAPRSIVEGRATHAGAAVPHVEHALHGTDSLPLPSGAGLGAHVEAQPPAPAGFELGHPHLPPVPAALASEPPFIGSAPAVLPTAELGWASEGAPGAVPPAAFAPVPPAAFAPVAPAPFPWALEAPAPATPSFHAAAAPRVPAYGVVPEHPYSLVTGYAEAPYQAPASPLVPVDAPPAGGEAVPAAPFDRPGSSEAPEIDG